MLKAVVLALSIVAADQARPVALPNTPQGRAVETYLKAFNAGDEKAFLDTQERLLNETQLKRRTREERAALYKKMRENLGTLTVERVLKATPLTIQVRMRANGDAESEFTFDFEEKAPFKMSGIGVEVQMRGGPGQ